MAKIVLNATTHTIPNDGHPVFIRGEGMQPDMWACAYPEGWVETEIFWGVEPGKPVRYSTEPVTIRVDSSARVRLPLPPKRAFARRWGNVPYALPANWKRMYGPANVWLPDAPASGSPGRVLPPLGPWRPWGPSNVDAVGGEDISHGYSREDPVYAWDAHSGCMDRAWVYYKHRNGEPLTVDDVGCRDYDGSNSPESNGNLLEFAAVPRTDGLPAMFDWSHFIRQCRYAIACHAQCPSPLVTRHIIALAEHARLAFSERGPIIWDAGYQSINLNNYSDFTMRNGLHRGMPGNVMGRYAGWIGWIRAMRLKVGGAWGGWEEDFLDLCYSAAMPSGFLQRNEPNADDQWKRTPGFGSAQVFDGGPLLACGAVALHHQRGQIAPQWIHNLLATIDAMPRVPYGEWPSQAHYVDTAEAWPGAVLTPVRPIAGDANPAPWHTESLRKMIA